MSESPAALHPDGEAPRRPHRAHLRRVLLAGLVTLVPVALTAYVLVGLFRFLAGISSPLVDVLTGERLPDSLVPLLGIVLTLFAVLLLGWLSTNVVGRRLIRLAESLIARIPVAKSVHSATKGVLEAISHSQAEAFKRVVLVEYPRPGLYAIGFVTGNAQWAEVGEPFADLLLVFVPTTPNPTSGFLEVVPRREVIELSLSVEEGVRLVVSGGILVPPPPRALPCRPPRAPAAAAPRLAAPD